MKQYKLIKEYPTSPPLGTILTLKENGWYQSGTSYAHLPESIEIFPEFWKEIKEPLFTTEDGVDVYEGDEYWYIVDNYTYPKAYTPLLHCVDWSNPIKPPLGKVQFFEGKNALKWIDENKPVYSKKQIIDALDKSHPTWSVTNREFDISIFIKELNLD
jgi:hypothetical protein